MSSNIARHERLIHYSIVGSLGLHGALALYLIYFPPHRPGAIDRETAAISINLEATDVVEAIQNSPQNEAASSPAGAKAEMKEDRQDAKTEPTPPIPEKQNAPHPVEKAPAQEQQTDTERPAEQEPKPSPMLKDETATMEPQDEDSLRVAHEIEKQESEKKHEEQRKARVEAERKNEERRAARAKERQSSREGAASAMSARGTKASKGRVSASAGSIQTYAAVVRARIAANKPASASTGRNVVIAMSITSTGVLSGASIVQSSGDGALDHAALTAVHRSSPFPPPPTGVTMRFTIPFQFH